METNERVNPYMSHREREDWVNGNTVTIGEYTIQPKRDFGAQGFYDAPTRATINMGWIITKENTHAVPGAGWFHTIEEATVGLNLLIASKGDADVYHALSSAMEGMARVVTLKDEAALKERVRRGIEP